jgi:CBS domain-containing protein
MMKVAELRAFDRSSLVTVEATATVHEAVKTMAGKAIGAVLVVEDEKVAGIFTERDLMNKVVGRDLDTRTTRISDVMTRDLKTARVDDEAIDCLELMAEGGFRHLPVVDGSGRPIGMVSQRDFVATTLPQALSLARQTAKATVSKRYQPVAIAASVVAYTLVIVMAVRLFT